MKKILIATTNPAKIIEYEEIFKQLKLPVSLVSLKDLNIKNKVEEDGKTFEENAIKKADFYSKLSNLPTLSDDGGLEIDYLNGEPGIRSRRWPGHEASDEELIELALKKMEGVPKNKRTARFRIIVALSIPDNKTFTFEDGLKGIIMEKALPKRMPGYPFRAIFYLPEIKKIFGELTLEEEVKIGHRKRAVEKALPVIREYLC